MRNLLLGATFLVGACTGAPLPVEPESPADPPGPGASEASIDFGECEGSPYRAAGGTGDTGQLDFVPAVWTEVSVDGRLVVHLDDMSANCCPQPQGSFVADGFLVQLDFVSQAGTSGCDCVCVFDFVATSEPFVAGEYTLSVSYDGTAYDPELVVVP